MTKDKLPGFFREQDADNFWDNYDKRKLFLGIRRHISLILFSTLLFGGYSAHLTYKFLTSFKAEATVLYQEKENETELKDGYALMNVSLPTALDMIQLPENLRAVKSILGLDLPENKLAKMIAVPVPKNESNLITIVCKGDNPHLTVDIANTLAKVAVKNSREFTRKQLQVVLDNFKNELAIVRQELDARMQDIENFKKKNRYFEMSPYPSTLLAEVKDAQNKLENAKLHYSGLVVEYENLKRDAEAIPGEIHERQREMGGNTLQSRIATLETSLAEARARYAQGNPKIKVLEEELSYLQQQAQNQGEDVLTKNYKRNTLKDSLEIELMRLQGKVRSAQKVKEDVAINFQGLESRLEGLPAEQMSFVKLLQGKQFAEEKLQFLTRAAESTRLMLNVPKGSIELYQLAESTKPYKDSWWVKPLPIIGLLFGLSVGLVLAVLLETRDSKLRTSKQIQLAYTIPCLLRIPEIPFLSLKNAQEKMLFFIRRLVERLGRDPVTQNSCYSITVTSSVDEEGKTLLAEQLALYYRNLGKKVVLLAFDSYGQSGAEKGLDDILEGNASFDQAVYSDSFDRLCVQRPHPMMKERLKSDRMTDLWSLLREKYQIIIIDAPGVIKDSCALDLAELADLPLFVVNSSDTKKQIVDQSLEEFKELGVVPRGFILNRILSTYVDDAGIKQEIKKGRRMLLKQLFFWKK